MRKTDRERERGGGGGGGGGCVQEGNRNRIAPDDSFAVVPQLDTYCSFKMLSLRKKGILYSRYKINFAATKLSVAFATANLRQGFAASKATHAVKA